MRAWLSRTLARARDRCVRRWRRRRRPDAASRGGVGPTRGRESVIAATSVEKLVVEVIPARIRRVATTSNADLRAVIKGSLRGQRQLAPARNSRARRCSARAIASSPASLRRSPSASRNKKRDSTRIEFHRRTTDGLRCASSSDSAPGSSCCAHQRLATARTRRRTRTAQACSRRASTARPEQKIPRPARGSTARPRVSRPIARTARAIARATHQGSASTAIGSRSASVRAPPPHAVREPARASSFAAVCRP